MTENIERKIASLREQIASLDTMLYLQELIVTDAEAKTGDDQTDGRLLNCARDATSQIPMLKRQLEVRKAALTALEAEIGP